MAHIEDRWEKQNDGARVRTERYGKGDRWRARDFDPNGQERARTFARKADAERFLAGVESDKSRGLYVDPAAGRITVREYATSWQKAQVHRRTTAAAFDSHLRNHIIPLLGHRPMGAITRSEIQGWVKSRSEVLAPSTTTLVYSVLRMIFRAAVADRVLAISPCERITLPKAPPREVRPLPADAVAGLAAVVPERYRALLICAAGTGLRQGEVLGLRRDRVDFLRRTLTVDGQLVLMPGAPPYLAPPKTTASYRTVPLADVVLDALSAHVAAIPAALTLDARGRAVELMFSDDKDRPIGRTWFHRTVWRPAVLAAGLPTGSHFHELRHFYASLLIDGGESVKVVQARLGHATADETLNTYAHLWPDTEERSRAAVDAGLGRCLAATERTTGRAQRPGG
jgi:integrase